MSRELLISVDIEASGPVPGIYSMLALGACLVTDRQERFYVELKPLTQTTLPAAMKVVGRTLDDFQRNGREASEAIAEFGNWIKRVSSDAKPVFVGFNASFDWAFVNWYFHRFKSENPFGVGSLDIKSFYMGMSGCSWGETRSSRLPVKYQSGKAHTHNALSDALEQAEVFEAMARDAGVIL